MQLIIGLLFLLLCTKKLRKLSFCIFLKVGRLVLTTLLTQDVVFLFGCFFFLHLLVNREIFWQKAFVLIHNNIKVSLCVLLKVQGGALLVLFAVFSCVETEQRWCEQSIQ